MNFGSVASTGNDHPARFLPVTRLNQLRSRPGNHLPRSNLCGCFNEKLPEKRYKIFSLAHSSLTGSDLICHLCRQLGLQPQMRRSDNVADIHSALGQLAAPGRCWCSKKRKTSRPVHWKK
jgi:hypothetical protein